MNAALIFSSLLLHCLFYLRLCVYGKQLLANTEREEKNRRNILNRIISGVWFLIIWIPRCHVWWVMALRSTRHDRVHKWYMRGARIIRDGKHLATMTCTIFYTHTIVWTSESRSCNFFFSSSSSSIFLQLTETCTRQSHDKLCEA